jgi:hypothetical protein
LNRIKLILASAVIAAFFVVPAAASATPVNLTEWSPTRNNDGYAGKWQSIAVNPTNGNQLVAFYQSDGTEKYSAGVWTPSGDTVGSLVDLATGSETNTYSTPVGAYNPQTGGWMVVYFDYDIDDYKAQLLNADGSLSGSAQIISDQPGGTCCHNPDIAWDSAKQQFFVVWAEYGNGGLDGQPQARFVNPTTGAPVGSAPIDLVTNASDFDWNYYHSIQVAYSTKQDGFGIMFRGYLQAGGEWRPYFLRLDSDGQPIGTPQMISSGTDLAVGNGSITYSKASDRYAVAWSDYDETGGPVLVQLFSASTGNAVGSPVVQPLPATVESSRYRIHIAADEYGSGYTVVSIAEDSSSSSSSKVFTLWLDSSAQPVGTPGWLTDDLAYAFRPQVTFDRHSGCFRATFIGATAPSVLDIYSAEFGTSGPTGCSSPTPSGKKKPSLGKAGVAGATSLRVKVGCGGASACRIKLSGKLKGGSGKLDGKTVKVKAGKKKTVKLAYSSGLISELSGRGGSKIKVTAKQVGGKSRTITVAVPDSVTG